jgi:conjugative transfer signal peptidase TraF
MVSVSCAIAQLTVRFSGLFKLASIKKGLLGFSITLAFFFVLTEQVNLVKNHTDSMPERYFVQLLKIAPKKGDITLVYSPWYQGNLIKRIIGIEGDKVHIDNLGNVYVNQQFVGKPQTHAGDGRSLNPIKETIIPKGFVFLYAPHPKSFDSRYQEVGLVPVNQLRSRLIPIKVVK